MCLFVMLFGKCKSDCFSSDLLCPMQLQILELLKIVCDFSILFKKITKTLSYYSRAHNKLASEIEMEPRRMHNILIISIVSFKQKGDI